MKKVFKILGIVAVFVVIIFGAAMLDLDYKMRKHDREVEDCIKRTGEPRGRCEANPQHPERCGPGRTDCVDQ